MYEENNGIVLNNSDSRIFFFTVSTPRILISCTEKKSGYHLQKRTYFVAPCFMTELLLGYHTLI